MTTNFINKKLEYFKMSDSAYDPKRIDMTSSRWDIYLIGRQDGVREDVFGEITKFNTNLQITVPEGYMSMIVAKSILGNLGYEIPSGIQTIFPGDTSELIVPLRKTKNTDDLDLPIAAVEIFMIQHVQAHLAQTYVMKESLLADNFGSSFGVSEKEQQSKKKGKAVEKKLPPKKNTKFNMF